MWSNWLRRQTPLRPPAAAQGRPCVADRGQDGGSPLGREWSLSAMNASECRSAAAFPPARVAGGAPGHNRRQARSATRRWRRTGKMHSCGGRCAHQCREQRQKGASHPPHWAGGVGREGSRPLSQHRPHLAHPSTPRLVIPSGYHGTLCVWSSARIRYTMNVLTLEGEPSPNPIPCSLSGVAHS